MLAQNLTSKNRIIVKTVIVGVIIRISKANKAKETKKVLSDLTKKNRKTKTVADFYGKLPGAFGDGLEYQKRMRNEWQ